MTRVDLIRDGLLRPPETEPALEAAPQPRPSDGTPCAFCGRDAQGGRCVHCERACCEEDRWIMYGLCRECLTEAEVQRAREPPDRPRPDLGIKWVED